MELNQFLLLQNELELMMAELYGEFSILFPGDSEFWQKLRNEEIRHSKTINRILELSNADSQLFRIARPVSPVAMQTIITGIKSTIERGRKGAVDAFKALIISRDLEISLFEMKLSQIVQTDTVKYESLMRSIAEETSDHVRYIESKIATSAQVSTPR